MIRPAFLWTAVFAALHFSHPASAEPKVPEPNALAIRLVRQVARVREGDLVQIVGGSEDTALLESLAVHVRRQGGDPLITLKTGRLFRRFLEDVPAKYDSKPPELERKLAEWIHARIVVESGDFDLAGVGLPADRLHAATQANEAYEAVLLKRGVRQVYLGNGLYPTVARARAVGLSHDELSSLFWGGVNVDLETLQKRAELVRQTLAAAKEVRLTHANGTDLKLRVAGRPVHVSDGIVTPEKEKRGGAACQVWLPAGEVYVTPVPDSVEGVVVIDRLPLEGKEVVGLRMTFSAGRLKNMTAKSGLERLQALYDAAGKGRDAFGFLDIGVNPNVKLTAESKLFAWMAGGVVTLGLGRNDWAGGDNTTAFGVAGQLLEATLQADDHLIIDRGVLNP